jgi:hypothetical protein
MKQGYPLSEIDGMDILFYFRLIRHQRDKRKEEQLAKADRYSFI